MAEVPLALSSAVYDTSSKTIRLRFTASVTPPAPDMPGQLDWFPQDAASWSVEVPARAGDVTVPTCLVQTARDGGGFVFTRYRWRDGAWTDPQPVDETVET